jgi:hypothetical protein
VAKLWREASAGRDDAPIGEIFNHGIYLAYAAGADQELEACCEELPGLANFLRAARRPKPPSLKEQAIAALSEMSIEPCLINDVDVNAAVCAKYNTIRRALETLDD